MGKAQIKPHKRETNTVISPAQTGRLNQSISFSFKHLDFENKKFQIPRNEPEYFATLLERFQAVCRLTLQQFRVECSRSIHSHPINWDTASENGFKNIPQELQEAKDYQFSISKVKYGRIHGVLLDSIFYIVWFDPDHKLSPSQ